MIETRATGASVGSSIKPDHQIPMKTPNPMNSPQIRLNHLALMVAAAALVGSTAHALTTTTVIDLGPPPGTAFTRSGGLYTKIPTGTLPAGSVLRAVSWNVSLWGGDPYLGDLTVYIADSDGSNPVLQVGSVGAPGSPVDGAAPFTAPVQLPWHAGSNYNWGATASTTLTATDGVPAIDLSSKTVFLENCYGNGSWAGTITLTYDVVALAVAVTTPANPYGYVTGTDIMAEAAVSNGTAPYTVTFFTSSGAGNTTFTQAGQVSSPPYQVDLGALPNGVYNLYATVADGNGGNASSPVTTFYVGVQFSAATSWTGTASSSWWNYPSWDSGTGYPSSSDSTVIHFTGAGTYTSTQTMGDGFVVNELDFDNPVLTLAGNSLMLTNHGATLPRINQNSSSAVIIGTPLNLAATTTFGGSDGGRVTVSGMISGSGGLIKDSSGVLQLNYVNNTYSGGTIINAGRVTFDATDAVSPFFGSGPVTINPGATIDFNRTYLTNAITLNGTTVTGGNSFSSFLSGPVTLTGITTFNFGTTGGFALTGNVSGTGGLTTIGTTQWHMSGTNSYTGPTTIQAGTIAYDTAASVAPGALNIASGGMANLNYSGTTTVASLSLGGVAQTAAGTYGSSSSGASVQNDTYFAGTGTVTVPAASGYSSWAATNAPTGTAHDDYDGDGVSNGVEYVLGGTMTSNDLGKLPSITTTGGNLVFTFKRDQASIDGSTTVAIEVGTDLVSWPNSYTVGADTGSSSAGVTVIRNSPTNGVDTVTLSVPQGSGSGKFARLKVVVPAP